MINTEKLRRELLETDGEVEIRREQDRIRTAKRRALETPAKQDKCIMIIITLVIIVHILKVVSFYSINEPKHMRVLHNTVFLTTIKCIPSQPQ